MALDFNTSGSRVDCGSGSTLDNLGAGAFTAWTWVYRTTNGGNQHIITKDGSFPSGWALVCDNIAGEGQLRFIVFRVDTSAGWWTDFQTAAGVVPLNTWTYIAAAYDDADTTATRMRIYTGSLTSAPAEVTYTQQQIGSGSSLSDAAYNLYVGNLQRATTLPFLGRIARAGIVTRKLDLAEATRIWMASLGHARVANTVLLLDLHGTGTQPDLSGTGNNGTVTTAAVAAHVPLPAAFGAEAVAEAARIIGGGSVALAGAGAALTTGSAALTVSGGTVALGAAGLTATTGSAVLAVTGGSVALGAAGTTSPTGTAALSRTGGTIALAGAGAVTTTGAATLTSTAPGQVALAAAGLAAPTGGAALTVMGGAVAVAGSGTATVTGGALLSVGGGGAALAVSGQSGTIGNATVTVSGGARPIGAAGLAGTRGSVALTIATSADQALDGIDIAVTYPTAVVAVRYPTATISWRADGGATVVYPGTSVFITATYKTETGVTMTPTSETAQVRRLESAGSAAALALTNGRGSFTPDAGGSWAVQVDATDGTRRVVEEIVIAVERSHFG